MWSKAWKWICGFGNAVALVVRFIVWALDLDDGSGTKDWRKSSPSLAKVAGASTVFVGLHVLWVKQVAYPALNFLITAGITALYGRSMWNKWLSRNTFATDMKSVDERKEVHEVREFKYTAEGIPAASLPALVGAKTPAGDD